MKTRRWANYAPAFGMALVFSLLQMTSNGPLFRTFGSDSAIFVTIGRAIVGGKVPYTDIFDHKGPVIFYLNALAQAISTNVISVWALEFLFLFASLCVIRRIALALSAQPVWAVQLLYLALTSMRLDGGNYTEEYCNLFTLLAFDWMLQIVQADAPRWKCALGVGAMFGLCAMTRLNNAMPIGGMVLPLLLWMLFAHKRMLWKTIVWMAAGVVAVVLPFLLYFAAVGAFDAFVYSAFVHNWMYTQEPLYSRSSMLLSSYGYFAMLCGALSLGGLALTWKQAGQKPGMRAFLIALVFSSAFAGASAMLSHKAYLHYLLLCIPPAAVSAAVALGAASRWPTLPRRALFIAQAVVVCGTLLVFGGRQIRAAIDLRAAYPHYEEDCLALVANIPTEDRADVLGYRIEPKCYVASGIVPSRRLFFMQEILAQVDPALMDELDAMFQKNPPKWLLFPKNFHDINPLVNTQLLERIQTIYYPIADNAYNYLFRLINP